VFSFQNLTLLPSTAYTLQFWVKSNNVSSQGVRARYVQIQPSTITWNSAWTNGTTDWKRVTTTFTTPANYVTGRVDLQWTLDANDVAWFDDVTLCQGSCP
jgi:hypothetical protein